MCAVGEKSYWKSGECGMSDGPQDLLKPQKYTVWDKSPRTYFQRHSCWRRKRSTFIHDRPRYVSGGQAMQEQDDGEHTADDNSDAPWKIPTALHLNV